MINDSLSEKAISTKIDIGSVCYLYKHETLWYHARTYFACKYLYYFEY